MLQGAQLALSRVVDPGHLPRLSRGASRAIVVVLEAAPRLLGFAERARKLLLAEEWIDDGERDTLAWCPTCKAKEIDGHKPDCELAALLWLK